MECEAKQSPGIGDCFVPESSSGQAVPPRNDGYLK